MRGRQSGERGESLPCPASWPRGTGSGPPEYRVVALGGELPPGQSDTAGSHRAENPVEKCLRARAFPEDQVCNCCFPFCFVAVQLLCRVYLLETPCTVARLASLSITNSQSLFKLIMSIELIIWQLRARTAAGLRVSCSLKYLWGTICSWHFLGARGRTAGVRRPSHRQSHPSGEDRPWPNQRVVNFLGVKPYVCISSFSFPSALVLRTLHPVLLWHLYSCCHGSGK